MDGVKLQDRISRGMGVARGAVATLQAGADIVLISHQLKRQLAGIAAVTQAVERGAIPMARIDEAMARVRRLKESAAAAPWRERPVKPAGLMKPEAMALSLRVQKAAVRTVGAYRPLDPKLSVALVTFEMRSRTEIDEVALSRNNEPRSSMLAGLSEAGLDVREFALSAKPTEAELAEARTVAEGASQIVVQTYNAVLEPGQQEFIASMPPDKLWLVAGRLPYDLDLAPAAQGRLAGFGCRPAALVPIVEKLTGA